AAASGADSGRLLRGRRARQAGRDVVETAPSRQVKPLFLRPEGTMSLLVKICGLSTRETLDVALEAGADMVGFVFFPPSPRHLSLEVARELGGRVKRRAVKVALTVDADDATLANIVEALQPDILHLHLPFMGSGGLTAANVAEGVGVTRAGGVDVSSGVEQAPGVKDPEMIHAFIRAARATEELMVR